MVKGKMLGGDAFFIEHIAELKESGFEILPRMALCEEAPHLEMYHVNEGFGLEGGTRRSFEAVLETFSGEKVLSKKPNGDLWNPIAIKAVAEVDWNVQIAILGKKDIYRPKILYWQSLKRKRS